MNNLRYRTFAKVLVDFLVFFGHLILIQIHKYLQFAQRKHHLLRIYLIEETQSHLNSLIEFHINKRLMCEFIAEFLLFEIPFILVSLSLLSFLFLLFFVCLFLSFCVMPLNVDRSGLNQCFLLSVLFVLRNLFFSGYL